MGEERTLLLVMAFPNDLYSTHVSCRNQSCHYCVNAQLSSVEWVHGSGTTEMWASSSSIIQTGFWCHSFLSAICKTNSTWQHSPPCFSHTLWNRGWNVENTEEENCVISLSQGPWCCFVPSQNLWSIGNHFALVVPCAKACNLPGGLWNLFLTVLMESFRRYSDHKTSQDVSHTTSSFFSITPPALSCE